MLKKFKITAIACVMFTLGGMIYFNGNSVQAAYECINGCMGPGDGCACNGWHPYHAEYSGGIVSK
jgi:hypothetical protein